MQRGASFLRTYLGELLLFVESDVRQRQAVPSVHVPVLVADGTVDHLSTRVIYVHQTRTGTAVRPINL